MFAPNLNKPQGLLGSYGMNPLMALGSGLLSAGGYTTMPVSTGQGFAAGFENMQRQGLLSAQMQRQEQEDAYRQQILDMKRAEAERQAAAQKAQGEGMAGLLAQVPPEHRATVAAIAAADPKRGVEVAQGLLMPEPEKLPTSVQEALWLESAPPDQRAAYMAMKQAGASRTNVNVNNAPSSGLSERPLTPSEAELLGVNPAGRVVDDKGRVKPIDLTEGEKMRAKRLEAIPEIRRLLGEMRDLGMEVEGNYNPVKGIELRRRFDVLRDTLVAAFTKNILGSPGAEPSPALYDRAYQIIPDVGMMTTERGFKAAMGELERMLKAVEEGPSNSSALTPEQQAALDKYGG